jgi:hypothetical protein
VKGGKKLLNSEFEKRKAEKGRGGPGLGLALGLVIFLGGLLSAAEAAVVITPTQEVVMSGSGLNEVIADGGAVTVGETLTGYTHIPGNFYEISVSFKILPDATQTNDQLNYMISGDYRVLLRHGSGIATPDTVSSFLLKNVGQEYVFPRLGYWDEGGMDITLEDSATTSIQGYRSVVTGDHMTEVPGVLGGTWRPFESMGPVGLGDPNGVWHLVFEDAILGGQGNLESWSITLKAVPEPGSAGLVLAGIGGLWVWRRRIR